MGYLLFGAFAILSLYSDHQVNRILCSRRRRRRRRSKRPASNVDDGAHLGVLPDHPEPRPAQEQAPDDPRRARADDGSLVGDDGRLPGSRFDDRDRLQVVAVYRGRCRRPLAPVVGLQLHGHRHLSAGQLRDVPTLDRRRLRRQRLAH